MKYIDQDDIMSNNVYFTFFTSRWQLRLMIGLSFNVILCEKMLSNGMSHYNCEGSHAFNLSKIKWSKVKRHPENKRRLAFKGRGIWLKEKVCKVLFFSHFAGSTCRKFCWCSHCCHAHNMAYFLTLFTRRSRPFLLYHSISLDIHRPIRGRTSSLFPVKVGIFLRHEDFF